MVGSLPVSSNFEAFYQLLDETGLSIVELGLRFGDFQHGCEHGADRPEDAEQVAESVAAVNKGPLPADVLARLDAIAALLPCRPFEEPMILPFNDPDSYSGPGMANLGVGPAVGRLD